MAAILSGIEAHPRISRPELAALLLGEQTESAELEAKKSALASDLHYLIHAGHVIEFHDGGLDLPLSPKQEAGPAPGEKEVSTDSGAAAVATPPSEPSGTLEPSGTEAPVETSDAAGFLHEEPAVFSGPAQGGLAADEDGNP
jgi:hypothetical protein